jgi:hypothetical protein
MSSLNCVYNLMTGIESSDLVKHKRISIQRDPNIVQKKIGIDSIKIYI